MTTPIPDLIAQGEALMADPSALWLDKATWAGKFLPVVAAHIKAQDERIARAEELLRLWHEDYTDTAPLDPIDRLQLDRDTRAFLEQHQEPKP